MNRGSPLFLFNYGLGRYVRIGWTLAQWTRSSKIICMFLLPKKFRGNEKRNATWVLNESNSARMLRRSTFSSCLSYQHMFVKLNFSHKLHWMVLPLQKFRTLYDIMFSSSFLLVFICCFSRWTSECSTFRINWRYCRRILLSFPSFSWSSSFKRFTSCAVSGEVSKFLLKWNSFEMRKSHG